MILHLITFMETKTFATFDAKLASFFKYLVLTHSMKNEKFASQKDLRLEIWSSDTLYLQFPPLFSAKTIPEHGYG